MDSHYSDAWIIVKTLHNSHPLHKPLLLQYIFTPVISEFGYSEKSVIMNAVSGPLTHHSVRLPAL